MYDNMTMLSIVPSIAVCGQLQLVASRADSSFRMELTHTELTFDIRVRG
jgi:hypothetical protein